MTDLTPREIVSELDRFIIGQNDAAGGASNCPMTCATRFTPRTS